MPIPLSQVDTNVVAVQPTTTVGELLELAKDQPSRGWTWVVAAMGGDQYAITRMSEIAKAAEKQGATILDMTLAQIPDLLHAGPGVQASASLDQARALAREAHGQRIPVLDGERVLGVLDPGPRQFIPLRVDLWALAAGGAARFEWPYDEFKLSEEFVVVDRQAPVAELAAHLEARRGSWTYLVVPWDGGTYRVMGVNAALNDALAQLPRCAEGLPVGKLPLLPGPAPGLEEGTVPWHQAKARVNATPGYGLVILRNGQPVGVLERVHRDAPQAAGWLESWPAAKEPTVPVPPRPDLTRPSPGEPPPTVRRYSDVNFPARTTVGVPADLRVGLTVAPRRPSATGLDFRPARADQPFDVDVYLMFSEDDFELEGGFHRRLTVPPEGDSNFETFRLTPLTEGPKQLTLDFHHEGKYAGSVTIKTTAQAAGQPVDSARPAEQTGGQLAFGGRPPDITLIVAQVQAANRAYRYLVDTPHPELKPDPASLTRANDWTVQLGEDPEAYVQSLIKSLNAWARSRSGQVAQYEAELETRGAYLYEKLFPRGLKEWYWAKVYPRLQQGTPTSLLIVSSEPVIPWELVRPAEPRRPGKFLCEAFILAQWIVPEPPPPDRLDLGRLGLVVPPSDLKHKEEEVQSLKALLGTTVHDIQPGLLDVLAVLKSADYSGLHIVGHGRYDANVPELSIVPLAGGTLTPEQITGDYKTLFTDAHPLVFLNACEVARKGVALSGLGGWAPALVAAGASIFLGSTWRVTDGLASRFSEAFYRALHDGDPAGEAVRKARLAIRGGTDPSWLGYALYGHPLAEVRFGARPHQGV